MSYNIDHSEYIGDGRLSIRRGDALCLLEVYDHQLPEGCWLDDLDLAGDLDEMLLINQFWWVGERSGSSSFDILIEHLLPETTGFAQIFLIWEGGDSINGIEVHDGVVTKKKVQVTLI